MVFVPVVPCRLFDTRPAPNNVGPRSTPLLAGDVYTQAVTGTSGNCTVPSAATAVAMNVTTVNGTAPSYLTVWPADATRPLASNLNWIAGSPPTPNKVDVKLSSDGKIKLFNNGGSVDVLADVVGYYADHNHDDRYYTKAEVDGAVAAANAAAAAASALAAAASPAQRTDTYSQASMIFRSSFAPFPLGGCITNSDGTPRVGLVPLSLPVNSRLVSVDVAIYDGGGASQYNINLDKTTVGSTSASSPALATASGGNTSMADDFKVHHYVLVPPTTEVVGADEALFLDIEPLDNLNGGFCGATVTYNTNG